MKILKKSEILAEANNHRQEQIDEGITLAKKVDLLRTTLAELEAQHTAYINGMKEQLKKEIEPLIKEKRELELGIKELTEHIINIKN